MQFLTICLLYFDQMHSCMVRVSHAHANTKLAFALSFIHLSPLSTFHSTAACQLASYLITVWAWTVNSEYSVVLRLH